MQQGQRPKAALLILFYNEQYIALISDVYTPDIIHGERKVCFIITGDTKEVHKNYNMIAVK
jgi:hypothetical protein